MIALISALYIVSVTLVLMQIFAPFNAVTT